jgi:hypothetical protein
MTPDICYQVSAFEWTSNICIPPRLIVEQCCTWRTISYCHHLKHGYRQMLSHNCIEWMSERHPPRRLTVGPSILEIKDALHRMNMGDKMNIIDDATAFLFTIWLEKLREIHEKEHWAYNDESFTASYEMHVWTTRWFPWRLVITYTWRVLFQLEASSWLIDNHDGCWHDAHNQSEDNS